MSDDYWNSIADEIAARRDDGDEGPLTNETREHRGSPVSEPVSRPDPWASTKIVGPVLTAAQISFLDGLDDQPRVPHLAPGDLAPDEPDESD